MIVSLFIVNVCTILVDLFYVGRPFFHSRLVVKKVSVNGTWGKKKTQVSGDEDPLPHSIRLICNYNSILCIFEEKTSRGPIRFLIRNIVIICVLRYYRF